MKTARRYRIPVLLETGTYLGDMVEANRRKFTRIISVELDPELARSAKERFKICKHISIIQGDSAVELPQILTGIEGKCLFWLDGHYSGGVTAKGGTETPVLEELRHIRTYCSDPFVLIDDARLFQGMNDYPSLPALERVVRSLWPDYTFEVIHDIIHILPPR